MQYIKVKQSIHTYKPYVYIKHHIPLVLYHQVDIWKGKGNTVFNQISLVIYMGKFV